MFFGEAKKVEKTNMLITQQSIKILIYFNTLAYLSTLYENISDLLRSKNKFEFHIRYDKCMMSYKIRH